MKNVVRGYGFGDTERYFRHAIKDCNQVTMVRSLLHTNQASGGGRGSRMGLPEEKTLMKVGGKSMIEHVIDALRGSSRVGRIIVAVSKHTPETAKRMKELSIEILETPGDDYVLDTKYAVKKLGLTDVLVVSADLPLVTTEVIDDVVDEYERRGKASLATAVPSEIREKLGFKLDYVSEVEGRRLVPAGINVLDWRRIDEPKLEQETFLTERKELAVNVNTIEDLKIAQRLFSQTGRRSQAVEIRKPPQTYRIARVSIFSALCVIGSFIHPPSPIQTVAFDSLPGFFTALYFGPLDGALVAGIGHIITSIINGFPLGILHFPIALGMALAGGAVGFANKINRKWGFIPGAIIGISINTALVVVVVPTIGVAGALALAPFLLIAATLNALIAALAYVAVRGRLRT